MFEHLCAAVDKHREKIFEAERFIWNHPESGFREKVTSKYMEDKFRELGYELTMADGITGFYTVVDTGRPGPEILVFGELDALSCPTHPNADPETGVAHACGHNAQCAALLGVAAALKEPGALDGLCGRIRLCAVPAEEGGELEFRKSLRDKGVLTHFSGKREFMYRGYFDGVDMAFLVHHLPVDYYSADGKAVGIIVKRAIFKGLAAHAGASPHKGRNALYAATQGLTAINAIRETFQEKDYVRVHPIITEGGGAVNTIPDRVCIETFVRALTFEALKEANDKANRALCGAAVSMGCELEIQDTASSAPMIEDKNLAMIAGEAIKAIKPDANYIFFDKVDTGSTDLGDVSCIMPVVHTYIPGVSGRGHGNDYQVSDPETACVTSAKWQLAMLGILLGNNAERAKKVLAEFKPRFESKEEYFAVLDSLSSTSSKITYNEDGSITVK